MHYNIRFKASAKKSLKKIPATDRERILRALVSLENDPRPAGSIKLTNRPAYRIRQGDYRVIYTIQDRILLVEIIRIGNRRDIYD